MKQTILFTAGAFGEAVGAKVQASASMPIHLAALPHDRDTLHAFVCDAAGVAVAAWRPYVQTFHLIDELCFAARVPWTLVEVHGQRLSCGPVVRPLDGPCYHCYRQRWASHHPAPDRELVIERAYARDARMGPPGFIGPLVDIAAAALIEDIAAPADQAGRLRLVDVLTGAVLETAVLGVHACPRCGLPREAQVGARFVRHLVPALEGSLS